jgi:hypothetical protein
MTKNPLSEIQVLDYMRDAIIHGIDANGLIVAAGTTPTYGGYQSGEDFYLYSGGGQESLTVFCPKLDYDDRYGNIGAMVPYIEIAFTPSTATRQTFGKEVRAGNLEMEIVIAYNQGYINISGTDYHDYQACMILRDRLYRILEKASFTDVLLLAKRDAEKSDIDRINEEGISDINGQYFRANVSMYIEFWPELEE